MVGHRESVARSVGLACAVVAVGVFTGWSPVRNASPTPAALDQLIGQRLVVAIRGTSPSSALLARVRSGQLGGVILFGFNVRSATQVRALSRRLQAAARAGGQPPLLIMADQEGGTTRRFAWAPPFESASELGNLSPHAVRAEAIATAAALGAVGVNVDLAPVVDVPRVEDAFIARQARAFSSDPRRVAEFAAAFAGGLAEERVSATAKHFPGLGYARISTDQAAVVVATSRARLDADLLPYRRLIESGIPLVMLANASYTALDGKPAAWSPAVERLLRGTLGFAGVSITDALDAVAPTHGRSVSSVAVLSAQAGVDLLLVTGSEAESDAVYARLLGAAEAGKLPRRGLERSYRRILALKQSR